VSLPTTESAPYDLVVDDGTGLFRVQTKYTSKNNGYVDLRCIHTNSTGYVVKSYKQNSYDWLFIYTESGRVFLVKDDLFGKTTITPKSENEVFIAGSVQGTN